MRTRAVLVLGLALSLASLLHSQTYPAGFDPPRMFRATTGLPYSADEIMERSQTLADGTRITQPPLTTKVYRDAEGRQRRDRPVGATTIIEIYDPVAGYRYVLDSERRVVHRSALPVPQAQAGPPAPAPPPPTGVSSETLPPKVIEGLPVEGSLFKMTRPAGQYGADRPITSTTESWWSRDLKTLLLISSSDPRWGDDSTRLTNIMRGQPDVGLFQIPSDYQVVDETERFTIVVPTSIAGGAQ